MKKLALFFLLAFSFVSLSYAEEGTIFCTSDAKLCPDGTWVGRTGPNCEFVCPNTSGTGTIGIPNPASVYCVENGGKSQTVSKPNGGQYSICVFDDNRQCEQWALFRGDCPVEGLKVTEYKNEESKYCAITGNIYIFQETKKDGTEIGGCRLKSTKILDAKEYFLNGASAEDEKEPLLCQTIYSPICGIDGKTYSNSCSADGIKTKYYGICLSDLSENKLKTAWDSAYKKYLKNDDVYNAKFLQGIVTETIKLARTSTSQSKISSYNYLGFLAWENLTNDIYTPYIEKNIEKIIFEGKVSSGSTFNAKNVTITWIDTNIAMVDYVYENIPNSMKISVTIKDDKFNIEKLEKELILEYKLPLKDVKISLKIPKSWEGKYSYEFSKKYNSVTFFYLANKEPSNILFSINFLSKEDWLEQIDLGGPFNNSYIGKVGDYIVTYSRTLEMPYSTDENISIYSTMETEMHDMVKTIKVISK